MLGGSIDMVVAGWNSGETCKSLPSEPVSPRRDKQGFAHASLRERLLKRPAQNFKRAGNSPRREGSRLSEIPRCSCPWSCALA